MNRLCEHLRRICAIKQTRTFALKNRFPALVPAAVFHLRILGFAIKAEGPAMATFVTPKLLRERIMEARCNARAARSAGDTVKADFYDHRVDELLDQVLKESREPACS